MNRLTQEKDKIKEGSIIKHLRNLYRLKKETDDEPIKD